MHVHWGDAGHKNRSDAQSTGGYVSGITCPEIMEGKQCKVSLMDWRSWKLRRNSMGSNGSEGHSILEALKDIKRAVPYSEDVINVAVKHSDVGPVLL